MSAVVCHCFLRNEMNLFKVSFDICILVMLKLWIIQLPILIGVTKSLHLTTFGFFAFQKQLTCIVELKKNFCCNTYPSFFKFYIKCKSL